MSGYFTVIAEFGTTPETHSRFLDVCAQDSARSVADEPGCHGFTVHISQDEADTIMLVETYADRAAFEAHLKTPHFQVFAAAVKEMHIEERGVRFLTQCAP